MKAQDFRALVEQLGDLSQGQRDALVEALTANGSGEEVIAMIETRFAAAPACGHCGETDFKPWGSASDLKRYMCNACGRTFNALTGTPLAGLRLREKWLDYARSLVDGVSLRKAAARTGIRLDTSFRWRHRFLAVAKDKKASAVTGIVEADETFILKSAKGSRKLVGRAPRKRGGKAKKPGLSTDEHDAILIVRDRHGETTDALLADLSAETISVHLRPVVAKDAVLVTDGNRPTRHSRQRPTLPRWRLSPAKASVRSAATTSKTSTPIRAASSSGWRASKAWRRSICRATSVGAE